MTYTASRRAGGRRAAGGVPGGVFGVSGVKLQIKSQIKTKNLNQNKLNRKEASGVAGEPRGTAEVERAAAGGGEGRGGREVERKKLNLNLI